MNLSLFTLLMVHREAMICSQACCEDWITWPGPWLPLHLHLHVTFSSPCYPHTDHSQMYEGPSYLRVFTHLVAFGLKTPSTSSSANSYLSSWCQVKYRFLEMPLPILLSSLGDHSTSPHKTPYVSFGTLIKMVMKIISSICPSPSILSSVKAGAGLVSFIIAFPLLGCDGPVFSRSKCQGRIRCKTDLLGEILVKNKGERGAEICREIQGERKGSVG